VGDEAVLIGRQGDGEITADEVAQLTGTISYETLCRIGPRVLRVYRPLDAADTLPAASPPKPLDKPRTPHL